MPDALIKCSFFPSMPSGKNTCVPQTTETVHSVAVGERGKCAAAEI